MEGLTYLLSYLEGEALYFQLMGLSILGVLFFSFIALRHKKSKTDISEVPAPLVKVYLEKYIEDSMSLHEELFGGGRKFAARPSDLVGSLGEGVAGGVDPSILAGKEAEISSLKQKLQAAEKKATDLNTQIEALKKDKASLEAKAKDAGKGAPAAPAAAPAGGGDVEVKKLQVELEAAKQRIQELEARLAEYDVIEDDLANLKKLQQENAQLKAQIKAMGGTPEAGGNAPAPTAAPTPPPAAAPKAAAPEPTPEPVAPAAEAKGGGDLSQGDLDALMSGAEAKTTEALTEAAAAMPQAAAPAAPAEEKKEEKKKDDSDLLSEFEKMLAQ